MSENAETGTLAAVSLGGTIRRAQIRLIFWTMPLFLLFGTGQPSVLSIQSFLEEALSESLPMKKKKAEVDAAFAQFQGSRSPWKTEAELSPSLRSSQTTSSSVGGETRLSERKVGATASLIQTLPSGTELSLSGTETVDPKRESDSRNFNYQVTAEQALLKNAFGRKFRIEKRRDEGRYSAELQFLSEARQRECEEVAKRFVTAYSSQKKLDIYREKKVDAEAISKVASRQFRRRLITRLESLAAKSDLIRAEQLFHEEKKNLAVKIARLKEKLPKLNTVTLEDPTPFFEEIISKLKGKKMDLDHPSLRALSYRVHASGEGARLAREEEKADLDLVLKGGTQEVIVASQVPSQKTSEHFVEIGLSFRFPLWDRGRHARISQAVKDEALAEFQRTEKLRELKQEYESNHNDLSDFEKRLVWTDEKIDLLNVQVGEARKQFQSGKIEFEDYQRYRDQLLDEQIRKYDLTERFWETGVQLAHLVDQVPKECQEKSP